MPGSGRVAPLPENEDFMTILTRLEQWKERGIISSEQHTLLAGLSRGEPYSLFLERFTATIVREVAATGRMV